VAGGSGGRRAVSVLGYVGGGASHKRERVGAGHGAMLGGDGGWEARMRGGVEKVAS
jgi:hypothetical protein